MKRERERKLDDSSGSSLLYWPCAHTRGIYRGFLSEKMRTPNPRMKENFRSLSRGNIEVAGLLCAL